MSRRVIVIGAGPMGLAAALGALGRGHEVVVLEAGRVGESLRAWGLTRLFTPLGMNVPPAVLELLGPAAPPADALLTGSEMIEQVLAPLSRHPVLSGRIREGVRVLGVGRAGLIRGELVGHPVRAERPFRLLAATPDGEELLEADVVLDASGVQATPAAAGAGGLPAAGEAAMGDRIIRQLGTLEERRARLAGRRILLIGSGHSAANAILRLERLAGESAGTKVTWAVRGAHLRPCQEVAEDPLLERRRVTGRANDLAASPPGFLAMRRRSGIERFACPAEGEAVTVRFTGGGEERFDEVISLTGYRPDHRLARELPLEIAPDTEGLGRLSRALSHVTDCLAVPRVSAEDLFSGEPGYHLIGSKSHGRARTFLLRTGLQHLEAILQGPG